MDTHTRPERIIETFTKPHGIDFDLQETFRKLATSQFGGDPARAFCELLQNAVDSYDDAVPMTQRPLAIESAGCRLAVRDEGTGLDSGRLALLTQLGGTDKPGRASCIGRFGIGFFSIFNPALGIRHVVVRTLCEGQPVRLIFEVDAAYPERPPRVQADFDPTPHAPMGSTVEVHVADAKTVDACLKAARKFVTYLPCPVTLNGKPFGESAWSKARRPDAQRFAEDACSGFLLPGVGEQIAVLCRYELICEAGLRSVLRAGVAPSHALVEYRSARFPYSNNIKTLINCNDLKVTVSRDSIHADIAFRHMLGVLRTVHARHVARTLRKQMDPELACINQFILAEDIGRALAGKMGESQRTPSSLIELIHLLADARVHQVAGEKECCSLREIAVRRTPGLPVYYSPSGQHVRWMGGAFRHDFVIVPSQPYQAREVSAFYDRLFEGVFGDGVNLDTIEQDERKVKDLIERGLVASELYAPACRLVGARQQTPREAAFIEELNRWIAQPRVCAAIKQSLYLDVDSVEAAFFDMTGGEITIATGLFEEDGRVFDNLASDPVGRPASTPGRHLRLGLWRGHPVIRQLVEADIPDRLGYALGFVAHQLIRCQRRLAPHSHFRQWALNDLIQRLHAAVVDGFLGSSPGYPGAPSRGPLSD